MSERENFVKFPDIARYEQSQHPESAVVIARGEVSEGEVRYLARPAVIQRKDPKERYGLVEPDERGELVIRESRLRAPEPGMYMPGVYELKERSELSRHHLAMMAQAAFLRLVMDDKNKRDDEVTATTTRPHVYGKVLGLLAIDEDETQPGLFTVTGRVDTALGAAGVALDGMGYRMYQGELMPPTEPLFDDSRWPNT